MTQAPRKLRQGFTLTLVVLAALASQGCSIFHQPGHDIEKVFSRVFLVDYNTAWQAALDSLKTYDRTVVNRQGGVIQTAWTDNTAQKNFIDAFGGSQTFLKAKFRVTLTVAPGSYNGKPSVRMSVLKEQIVQYDMLEGWKTVGSDSYDENTLLYRIGRLVFIRLKLKQIEEDKTKQILEEGV